MKLDFLKRGPLLIIGAAIIVTTAHALIDADSDGMSDVWEGEHGFAVSGTQPSHQLPTADPDGDGWTNLEESQAGTDPSSGVPPEGILKPTVLKHPDFSTVFTISWPSLEGKQYKLYVSPDLSSGSWVQIDSPMMGTGATIEYGTEAIDEDGYLPDRLFWKVSVADVDSDGDTYTDYEELAKKLNPNRADTDGDGFPDNTDPDPLDFADKDGANLSGNVTTGLLGRWDFEGGGPDDVTLVSTPNNEAGAIDIGNTGAGWDGRDDWPRAASGMPWACLHLIAADSHAKVPTTRLNHDTHTWAMWIKFPRATVSSPGALDSSAGKRTLFAVGKDETLSSNDPDSRPIVQCYFDGKGTTNNSSDNRLVLSNWDDGVESQLASWSVPAALDDGQWHHIAIYFDDNEGGRGKYRAWYDGGAFDDNQKDIIAGNVFTYTLNAASHPWCYLGRFMKFIPPGQGHETLGAQIDRLRVYNKVLQPSDVLALYNQDIDDDGLTDRFESRTRFWRDHNHDKIDQQSETTFPVSPFLNDPAGSDHDGDGLSTHDEQTRGTNPWKADSDGDLLPDGWEVEHGSSPSDTDGLTATEEYKWGTDPKSADTDGDGTNDSDETTQGSHPNDASDGGQPLPADQRLAIRIGVGDQSGSHSEDYVVECYRIDIETGEEKLHYIVRSGGFGQYTEQDYNIFRKDQTYTFRLKWQGTSTGTSSSGASDGPDYDYTFKVIPQASHGGILIDSWDKDRGSIGLGKKLLGVNRNDVAADESAFKEEIENRRVVLYSIQTHSQDRMFAGSVTTLRGFERLQLVITNPETGEDFGTHGYLAGEGDTRVYQSLKGMLGSEDDQGTDVRDPRVWFLQDTLNYRRTEFYLVSGVKGEGYGKIKVEARFNGQSLGSVERSLQAHTQFEETIDMVTGWAAGKGFRIDPGAAGGTIAARNNLTDGAGLSEPELWATPTLIPFMLIGHQVEGVTIVARGLGEGIVAGLKDDLEFAGLLATGAMIAADWTAAALQSEIQKWQDDPLARMSELHGIMTDFFQKQVYEPLGNLVADLSTFEGFKKLFWQAVAKGITISMAANNLNIWEKTVDALGEWFDDFGNRMAAGAESAAWINTPFAKSGLLAEGTQVFREQCYTFGYTLGYMCEQVAVGMLTGGAMKIGQVALKGGVTLAGNLAKRTAGAIAMRGHWMKALLGNSSLGDALVRFGYERGLLLCAVEPVGPSIKESVFEILEKLFTRSGFQRATFNFKNLLDDITKPGSNMRALVASAGGEALIQRRAAQLAVLLGDQCDETIMKNFLKVAEERLIILRPAPDGHVVDEFFEGFFRCFEGNPSLMVNADTAELSLSQLSANGKAYLKSFLSDPDAGNLWKIDDPLWVDEDIAIPHNYWVRGLLAEIDVYKRVYKSQGFTHHPTAAGFDLSDDVTWVQIKSVKNPGGAIDGMKKAIDKLAASRPDSGDLKLHILAKPGTDTAGLKSALDNYLGGKPYESRFEVEIEFYDLGPQ
ncbi:hypothetical protein OKA05_08290 [Luteolibacter arcticus]|uniref:LamG-like jellyroll fold domain-containing protein n=1 Tax=Luteolibacter arcticus TaxID=1581411 RepID=A0ABT3GGF9_9BACT|nr:LamG-like jellyroll fold domain-containing protein [Luteolibacter arcticus]MCW1922551.1 hypothetical protein [Luteolibacter arcticus]